MFKCNLCGNLFSRNDSLKRHLRISCIYRPSTSQENSYYDSTADVNSMSAPKKLKLKDEVKCEKCNKTVASSNYSSHLKSLEHKQNCIEPDCVPGVQIISSAFKKRIVSYRLTADSAFVSLDTNILIEKFIENLKGKIVKLIIGKLNDYHSLKVNFELFASFVKPAEEETPPVVKSFIIPYQVVDQATDFEELIQNLIQLLKKKLEEFQVSHSKYKYLNFLIMFSII